MWTVQLMPRKLASPFTRGPVPVCIINACLWEQSRYSLGLTGHTIWRDREGLPVTQNHAGSSAWRKRCDVLLPLVQPLQGLESLETPQNKIHSMRLEGWKPQAARLKLAGKCASAFRLRAHDHAKHETIFGRNPMLGYTPVL